MGMLAGFGIFIIGSSVGWFARGNWTAAWVAAAETWIGALGTIGAILWAVWTFSLQISKETVEAQKRLRHEGERARLVSVEMQSSLSGGVIQRTVVQVQNLSERLVSVEAINFDPSVVAKSGRGSGKKVDLPPDGQPLKVAFLVSEYPAEPKSLGLVVRYTLDGVTWKRPPDADPVRQ